MVTLDCNGVRAIIEREEASQLTYADQVHSSKIPLPLQLVVFSF